MLQLVVRAIIPSKGKYLLVKNKPSNIWCLPGGKVEPNEPIIDALERELIEELGVRPIVGQLLFVQQFADKGGERVEFFFLVDNPESYLDSDFSKASHGKLELAQAGFYALDEVDVLPRFLAKELPAVLRTTAPNGLPRFYAN